MQTSEHSAGDDSVNIAREVKVCEESKIIGKVTVTQLVMRAGVIIDEEVVFRRNLVVNGGRDNLARLLGGDSTLSVAYLALGDSKVSVSVLTDTALENEVKRIVYNQGADKTYPSIGSILFSRTVTGDEFAATTVIREGSLFLSDGTAAIDTGTMFNRVIFVDDNAGIGLTNAGLVFQPTNGSGVSINNKIDFEILF